MKRYPLLQSLLTYSNLDKFERVSLASLSTDLLRARHLSSLTAKAIMDHWRKGYQNAQWFLDVTDVADVIKTGNFLLFALTLDMVYGYRVPSPVISSVTATSKFGWRKHPLFSWKKQFHGAVDVAAVVGRRVYAFGPGVAKVFSTTEGGLTVQINDGYMEVSLLHLSRTDVEDGEFVPRGKLVGRTGSSGFSTGPHLHVSCTVRGHLYDPVDFGLIMFEQQGGLSG